MFEKKHLCLALSLSITLWGTHVMAQDAGSADASGASSSGSAAPAAAPAAPPPHYDYSAGQTAPSAGGAFGSYNFTPGGDKPVPGPALQYSSQVGGNYTQIFHATKEILEQKAVEDADRASRGLPPTSGLFVGPSPTNTAAASGGTTNPNVGATTPTEKTSTEEKKATSETDNGPGKPEDKDKDKDKKDDKDKDKKSDKDKKDDKDKDKDKDKKTDDKDKDKKSDGDKKDDKKNTDAKDGDKKNADAKDTDKKETDAKDADRKDTDAKSDDKKADDADKDKSADADKDKDGKDKPKEAYNPLKDAVFDIQSGRYADSIALLLPMLKKDPRNVQAHYILATTYVYMRKFDEAAAQYKEVLKLVPAATPLGRLASEGLHKLNK